MKTESVVEPISLVGGDTFSRFNATNAWSNRGELHGKVDPPLGRDPIR